MPEIICENKEKVRKILADNEISSRPLGAPLHTAYYLKCKGEYTTAKKIWERMLYLPGGPDQNIGNVEKVIQVLKSNDLV